MTTTGLWCIENCDHPLACCSWHFQVKFNVRLRSANFGCNGWTRVGMDRETLNLFRSISECSNYYVTMVVCNVIRGPWHSTEMSKPRWFAVAADEATRLIERSCKIHWQNLGPSLSINQLRHLIPTKWNNVFYLSSSAAVSFWRGKPQSSLAPEREKKRKNAIRLIAYVLSSNVHKLKRRRQLRSTGNPSSMGGLLRQRRVSSAQQPVI